MNKAAASWFPNHLPASRGFRQLHGMLGEIFLRSVMNPSDDLTVWLFSWPSATPSLTKSILGLKKRLASIASWLWLKQWLLPLLRPQWKPWRFGQTQRPWCWGSRLAHRDPLAPSFAVQGLLQVWGWMHHRRLQSRRLWKAVRNRDLPLLAQASLPRPVLSPAKSHSEWHRPSRSPRLFRKVRVKGLWSKPWPASVRCESQLRKQQQGWWSQWLTVKFSERKIWSGKRIWPRSNRSMTIWSPTTSRSMFPHPIPGASILA